MADLSNLSADVIVIGGGIAGGLAAHKLASAGADVLVLESGPELHRGQIVERFRNSAYKGDFMDPYPAAEWAPQPKFQPKDNNYLIQKGPDPYRGMYLRGTGGTTWHWAGQAFRLLPNDFRLRSLYDQGRDWPISYDDLEPFYTEAEYQMGVSGEEDLGCPRSRPYPMPGVVLSHGIQHIREQLGQGRYRLTIGPQARNSVPYQGRPACCGNNNCMPVCPVDAMYHGGISIQRAREAGARVLANAVVYRLETDAKGNIVAAHVLDPDKQTHRVTGKIFVLTANGLESPRLLLNSVDDKHPRGLANSSDMVGRNLMDHPGSSVEFLARDPVWFGRGPMRPASMNDFRDGAYRRDFAATRIDIAATNPVRMLTERLLAKGVYGEALNATLKHQAEHYVLLKSLFEMLPDPENRVVPSRTQKDAWGIPRLEIHYRFPDYVHKAYEACLKDFAAIAGMLGGTDVVYSPRGVYDNNQHITGTMIMGADPATSVVSGECRTHDHANLFIGGTGIMPSSATVNSTLTGVALSLKMAGHVLKQLA
jgi:glucose dehydrogenase